MARDKDTKTSGGSAVSEKTSLAISTQPPERVAPTVLASDAPSEPSFTIATTMPDEELRHDISDLELDMLHRGHASDRESDRAFDVFLAACGAAAGAAPQVIKDLASAFFASNPVGHDVFGIVALLIFGGAITTAAVMRMFWKAQQTPTAVDLKVLEIRARSNRRLHVVRPQQQATSQVTKT